MKDGARLFVVRGGVWITPQAGKIAEASYRMSSGHVTLILDRQPKPTPVAELFVEIIAVRGKPYAVSTDGSEQTATASC